MSGPLTYETYRDRKYLPELDGLRAISVLLVVSVHMHDRVWDWLAGGSGVTIFFVLSGYLITTLSLREEGQFGALHLKAFYIRRSFRIFPMYYAILIAYCVTILILHIDYERKAPMLRGALPWYLLYMQEVPFFYGVPDAGGVFQKTNIPFYQSWSLGIEEKFYLFWPPIAFVLWRGKVAIRFIATVMLIGVFCIIPFLGFGTLDSCLFPYCHILIGCLLALLLHDRRSYQRLRPLGNPIWGYFVLASVLALHFVRPWLPFAKSTEVPLYAYVLNSATNLLYTVAVALFLACVLLGAGPVQATLRRTVLVFIGKISYGIYLVHILALNVAEHVVNRVWPTAGPRETLNVASGVALVLGCIISVIVAYALHRIIEKPCIDVGRRWSKRVMDEAKIKFARRAGFEPVHNSAAGS